MPLFGKVALITISSKGIGNAAALRVARAKVPALFGINHLRDPASANSLIEDMGADRALVDHFYLLKSAIEQMTRILAKDLAGKGILVVQSFQG